MQGPLLALGGDLGGDGVRMQWGEVLLSPPRAGKSHCPGGGQGGSWAGREPGAAHGREAHPFPAGLGAPLQS